MVLFESCEKYYIWEQVGMVLSEEGIVRVIREDHANFEKLTLMEVGYDC